MKLNQIDAEKCINLLTGLDLLAIEYYNVKKARTSNLSNEMILSLRRKWQNSENKHFIEYFINYAKLNDEDAALVRSWMHCTRASFILREQTPEHAVVESMAGPSFPVLGLSQGMSESIQSDLPVFVRTALLPFKDQIIFDGFMEVSPADEKSLAFIEELRNKVQELHTATNL